MKITVRTVYAVSDLEVKPQTKIHDIYQSMCKANGIREYWWFGLMYTGADHEATWIDGSKKRISDIPISATRNLEFKVKFFPESSKEELIESTTVEFFFNEVKKLILSDEIHSPPDNCTVLASYALQAKYGDYDEGTHDNSFFERQTLLPQRVLNSHSLDMNTWYEVLVNLWKKLAGMHKEDAMHEYLNLSQNLDMYGVTYVDIRNKKQTDLLLGITALGLNVYDPSDKINPKTTFPWSEIKRLSFRDKKFNIKLLDKEAQDFVFFTASGRVSKHILNLGVGNHLLYVRRRKPDTPEIIKMKEKALELKKTREANAQRLREEKNARLRAEKREQDILRELSRLREEMAENQRILEEANATILKLQKQLEDIQRSKQELEKQKQELEEMMRRLEEAKNLEAAEKAKLEAEILAKQEEVLRINEEVMRKDEEARKLQEEVEEAKRREAEIRQKQLEEAERAEAERKRREEEKAAMLELQKLPVNANTELPELQEVNENLKLEVDKLKTLLDENRKTEEESELDKIHRDNLLQGRNKYMTLKQIRSGNTSRRVELFENF